MKVPVEGGEIAYQVEGTGPALLLLHAFPLSSKMWTPSAFPGHRVIHFDVRGFGGSTPGPITMDGIARDAAAVLDAASEPRAVVVGASMGGYAAFAFARLFPERVRALVLAGTKAAPDTDEARAGRARLAEQVRAEGTSALEKAMMPKLLGSTSHRERPELVARVRGWVREASPEAVVQALAGLAARPDARPDLPALEVPALIVRGVEDPVSTEADLDGMREGLSGSRALVIPFAGHLPSLETPAPFARAVNPFLASSLAD
jgi:pimeloyl-ACP methyl ester carboxylesterase